MIKVLELKGIKSFKVMSVFHTLMLGLKMLPSYAHEQYEDFYDRVSGMVPADQEKLIREALLFVNLEDEEIAAALSFTTDRNGVPIKSENIKNLGPKEIMDALTAVCMEYSKIKIDLVSETEKKNQKILYRREARFREASGPELVGCN